MARIFHEVATLSTGFDVEQGEDPFSLGRKRLSMAKKWQQGDKRPEDYGGSFDITNTGLASMISSCRPDINACWTQLHNNQEHLCEWLEEESWVLERYQSLLSYTDYQDPVITNYFIAPHPLSRMDAQWFYFIHAWQLGREGHVQQAVSLLRQDARFWRMVYAKSEGLYAKAIAADGMKANLAALPLFYTSFPAQQRPQWLPPAWDRTFGVAEMSLEMGYALDMAYAKSWLKLEPEYVAIDEGLAESMGFETNSRLRSVIYGNWWLFRPLMQQQDTLNFMADYFYKIINGWDGQPFSNYQKAYQQIIDEEKRINDKGWMGYGLYNPVGNLLSKRVDFSAGMILKSISEAESLRRAAILAFEVSVRGLNDEQIPGFLSTSDIRDPLTGDAFLYDKELHALRFEQLDEQEKGHYQLLRNVDKTSVAPVKE